MEAMLWEIFRRKPETQELHFTAVAKIRRHPNDVVTPLLTGPVSLAAACCCQTWPKLGKRLRWVWHDHLENTKPQRGFHPGALTVLNEYRKDLISSEKSVWENFHKISYHQSRMAGEIIEQDNKGKILFAVDPLASGIGKRVEQILKSWPKEKRAFKPAKFRPGQWGDVISSFENEELSRKRRKEKGYDQRFAKYRRIIAR